MENDLMKIKYKIKEDPTFGYKHLDPLPSPEQLDHFYKEQYYQYLQELLRTGRGGRNPKLSGKDQKVRKKEQRWLDKTYFTDMLYVFNKFIGHQKRKTLFDIGCGTGEFLQFMKKAGWEVFGIEPSKEASQKMKKKGIAVYSSPEAFTSRQEEKRPQFDVITLINVLEHVIDPKETIVSLKRFLKKGGILYVRVPNDFNKLQALASKKIKQKQWWIAPPSHLNYFSFQTLEKLLKFCGFEILLKTTDFPMELFLLMGDNYIDKPKLGKVCHQKRVNFEFAISKEIRKDFYQKLAEIELGISCRIYGRKI